MPRASASVGWRSPSEPKVTKTTWREPARDANFIFVKRYQSSPALPAPMSPSPPSCSARYLPSPAPDFEHRQEVQVVCSGKMLCATEQGLWDVPCAPNSDHHYWLFFSVIFGIKSIREFFPHMNLRRRSRATWRSRLAPARGVIRSAREISRRGL